MAFALYSFQHVTSGLVIEDTQVGFARRAGLHEITANKIAARLGQKPKGLGGSGWYCAGKLAPETRSAHFDVMMSLPVRGNRKAASVFNGFKDEASVPFIIGLALYPTGVGCKRIAKRCGFDRRMSGAFARVLKSVGMFDSKRPSPFHTGEMTAQGCRGPNKTACLHRNSAVREVESFVSQEREYNKLWLRAYDFRERTAGGALRCEIQRDHKRMMSTPHLRLKFYLRKRLKNLLNGIRRPCRTAELTGCTYPQLKRHIERQFMHGMTWANHGRVWHIDHIKACATFDLTQKEDAQRCFHYTNLRPLWARDNIAKGDKPLHRVLSLPVLPEVGQTAFDLTEHV